MEEPVEAILQTSEGPGDSESCTDDPLSPKWDRAAEKDKEKETGKKQMFADQEKMKQQLRDRMAKPTYDVANFYHTTGTAQMIARHRIFEMVTLAVIALNALWISIDTDMNHSDTLLNAEPMFQVAENLFCAYFFFEWLVRFLSFKKKLNGLRDAWFVFDSTLVSLMVVETWVMTFILLVSGASSSGGLGQASILRMARLLRLTRMARMARLLRSMPEMMILVHGMVAATRSVIFTLMLLLVILYVFAILFRQLSDGSEIGDEFFDSVPAAMHSLLIHGTFMDDLSGIAMAITEESPGLLPIFYAYVLLAALTLMNMLIGVLCEVVTAVANTEKEAMLISYVKDVLHDILKCTDLDTNKDGRISRAEFMHLFEDQSAIALLTEIDVDPVGLVGFADFIFEGEEGEEIMLSYDDLLNVILDIRGGNAATVRDIVDLRKFVKQQFVHLEHKADTRHHESSSQQRPPATERRPLKMTAGTLSAPPSVYGFSVYGDAAPPSAPDCRILTPQVSNGSVPFANDSGARAGEAAGEEPTRNSRRGSKSTSRRPSQPTASAPAQNLDSLIAELSLEALPDYISRPSEATTGKGVRLETEMAPLALCFQRLTKELVSKIEVMQKHDQAFEELRSEHKQLLADLDGVDSDFPSIPGMPATIAVSEHHAPRSAWNDCDE